MKKSSKIIATIAVLALVCVACVSFVACNDKDGGEVDFRKGVTELTFSAPEGTPALAMLRLVTDNEKSTGRKSTIRSSSLRISRPKWRQRAVTW